jgi:hypothetical protein
MDQQEQTQVPVPHADAFQVVSENCGSLTGQVKRCYLNFCHNILELDIAETKDFAILNWVVGLAKEEVSKDIVTVMSLDTKGKILCMLRFTDLTLLDHESTFNVAARTEIGGDPMSLMHMVHLKFEAVERVAEPPNIGG